MYLFVIGSLGLVAACAGPELVDSTDAMADDRIVETRREAPDRAREVRADAVQTLSDMLLRVPQLAVYETARGTDVFLRGRRPAFVIDGMPVGGYYDAVMLVPVQDIRRVDVLTSIQATQLLGARGRNGAVSITTR